jgi:hypothetical protein
VRAGEEKDIVQKKVLLLKLISVLRQNADGQIATRQKWQHHTYICILAKPKLTYLGIT